MKKYSLSEAYAYCFKITKNHYENFPVASLAIPRKLRTHVSAVYAFARLADDFADEQEFEGDRMSRLTEWEEELKKAPQGEVTHPVFVALQNTIQQFQIPLSLFENLLTAFKMDCVVKRYENFSQLLQYCRYSANPVGRIILHLFGYPAPKFMEYSDSICTALQLANFWQDVAYDWEKNRIYIPQEDFVRFGYSENDLSKKILNENFKRLILFQIERTRELFEKGKSLCSKIPGRLGFELRLTWLGGTTILDKIIQIEANVFNQRPVISKKEWGGLAWRALRKKTFASEICSTRVPVYP